MPSTVLNCLFYIWLATAVYPTDAHTEGPLITDEALHISALKAAFPGTQISRDDDRNIDDSWPKNPKKSDLFFPDALADEPVYRVVGKPLNQAEQTASENLVTGTSSDTRQVRMRLFQWPKAPDALLAVVQYNFAGANPVLSCPSLGILLRLVRVSGSWRVEDRYLLQTSHHSSVQKIQLVDLTGDGGDVLVIESSFGGAGSAGSTLQVFDLGKARFEELLNANSRLEYEDQEGYRQSLDERRTNASHGQRFCVVKTIIFDHGKWFDPPRVVHACYPPGYGVDFQAARARNKLLKPRR